MYECTCLCILKIIQCYVFQIMDIDIDFLDSYFNDPLEDNKCDADTGTAGDDWTKQQRRQKQSSTSKKRNQSSISTPRSRSVTMAPSSSSSPSCDVNYGPIVTDCDVSFISSTPTSCKYLNMDLVEDNFSLMARNDRSPGQDTATIDVSSSSSTLSAPSPIPISPSVEFVDLNLNPPLTGLEHCNQTTTSSNLNFNIQEVISIPPDVFSNPSPMPYSTMSNRNLFRTGQDLLDNHFDSQLSPAPAAASYNEQPPGISPILVSSAPSTQFYTPSAPSFASTSNPSASVSLQQSLFQNPFPPMITPKFLEVLDEKFVPPTFKTDISKFCNRDPERRGNVKVPQLGQNVIRLAKVRKPKDRLWYVDKNDSFKNIPVVKKHEKKLVHGFKHNPPVVKQEYSAIHPEPVIQKRGRGRPRGSGKKAKMMSKRDVLSQVVHDNRKVCARCFELLQQLR